VPRDKRNSAGGGRPDTKSEARYTGAVPEFLTRPATSADAPRLRAYLAALFDERCPYFLSRETPPTLDEAEEMIESYAETPRSAMFLAALPDAIVGMVQFSPHAHPQQRHTGHLAVSVLAPWRRRGVGRALMTALLEWAKGVEGLRRLSLEVFATNAPALRLYESLGFAVDGRKREGARVGEDYVDLLLMSRGV
jgi:RimJ/RimL family protein N-acetyltransferase